MRLLNQVAAFRYVTVDNAPTYRSIIDAFYSAKQRYVIELRPSDVLTSIRESNFVAAIESEEHLEQHLDKLVEWGNLFRSHDTASVSRIDDFYRKRYLFHLTAVGEAAHRAVVEVEATVGRSGSLQASMLVKVRDALRSLATETDAARLAGVLHDLHSSFDTLTQEANRFMGELNRFLGGDRIEEDRFVLYKEAVLAYISRFVEHLRNLASEIAHEAASVDRRGIDRLMALAATAAELPPAIGDADPLQVWTAEQMARWIGVRSWFLGSSPTVERLAEVAVDSVLGLTRALSRLNDRRSRPVDRAADFRRLAQWFSQCRTDEEAHSLWYMAFGVHSARHFHLEEDDADAGAGASWWDAEPVIVPVRLRTHGQTSNAGRSSPAADYTADKAWIAQRRKRERAQLEAAMHKFVDLKEVRLGDLRSLDAVEFDVFLGLVDEALTSPRDNLGARSTRTADGRLVVRLEPPRQADAFIVITTPRGAVRCLDYRLVVEEVAPSKRVPVASAEG